MKVKQDRGYQSHQKVRQAVEAKLVQAVESKVVLGQINPIAYDQLRLFNRKSPWRRTLDEIGNGLRHRRAPVYFAVNSKTDAWENGLLLLLFNNTNFATVGDATGLRGSTVAGNLWFSLHTADPGEVGDQTSSEIGYTSYGRAIVARSGAGFTVTGSSVSPASAVGFPLGTGGSGTASHCGIGTASSGAGVRLYNGQISPAIICGAGITPSLSVTTALTED